MIIVADSGSTHTDWVVLKNEIIISEFRTKGLNPYFTQGEEIYYEVSHNFPENIRVNEITHVFFYGSGCSTPEMNKIIYNGLILFFNNSVIEVEHDLLAAARALFMNNEGIAIILGTGANTCLYNGKDIIENIPSLGYILGDEGGGDYLGKLFITELLYGNIPSEIQQEFQKEYNLTDSQIMQKIYKEANPNRFLASFCEFISQHATNKFMDSLIKKSFTDLFSKHVMKYDNYQNQEIRVTGSVGFYFQNQLNEVANKFDASIGLIMKDPIKQLAQYHISNK